MVDFWEVTKEFGLFKIKVQSKKTSIATSVTRKDMLFDKCYNLQNKNKDKFKGKQPNE